MKALLSRYFPHIIVATWVAWLIGVLMAGAGANLFGGRRFNFELAGQFGDSFGTLSGFMAALAAAGAWYAVALQREQIRDQNLARSADDLIRRQQAFEQNFFQLLGHLSAIVRETDIVSTRFSSKAQGVTSTTFTGKDAFRRIVGVLHSRVGRAVSKNSDINEAYLYFYRDYQDDLGHYFRVLFHICNYVSVNSEIIDANFYLKIVFAQLSNSELILTGYNCAYGHGRRKFKPIIEQFGCLSNLAFDSEYDFDEQLLREELNPSALPQAM